MTDMFNANAFFLVATVAVALLTLAVLIAFVYLIRILRDASELSQVMKEEGKDIVEDISKVHTYVRLGASFIEKHFLSFFNNKNRKKK